MKTISTLIILVAAMYFTACSPVLYSSVGQNVPLFHEKGEVTISGGRCEVYDAKGFNLQFATAASDKLVVISSLYSMKSFSTPSNGAWSGKGSYFEVGLGKYGYSPENKWCYELISGVGYGSVKNNYDYSEVNANYIKPFFQPSIGVSGGVVEFALTPRIGLVTYLSNSNTLSDAYDRERVDSYFEKKGTSLVFEPGVTLRLGYRNVKIQFQYNYTTFSYDGGDQDSLDPVNPEFISIGAHFLLTNRFKK